MWAAAHASQPLGENGASIAPHPLSFSRSSDAAHTARTSASIVTGGPGADSGTVPVAFKRLSASAANKEVIRSSFKLWLSLIRVTFHPARAIPSQNERRPDELYGPPNALVGLSLVLLDHHRDGL